MADDRVRGTRRAVWRAIRTGRAPDARIDALARETADNTVRNTWMLVFWSVILGVQAVLLVVRIIAGGGVSLMLAVVVLLAAGVVLQALARSYSKRYLRGAGQV